MKHFFLYLLATIVGMGITAVLIAIFVVAGIAGVMTAGTATTTVKSPSVLVLPLDGTISEQADNNPLASLLGSGSSATGLDDILAAIKKAGDNSKIEGIYLEAGRLSTGFSTAQEIRHALAEFKKTGKWIIAYGDDYTQGAYYIASVADSIYLNPAGQVDLHGVASQTTYLKDLCGKFGVKFQIFKVGTFKSATEAYSEDHMSDANRAQLTTITAGMWHEIVSAIADSRHLTADSINALADHLTMFLSAEEMVSAGLVDSLLYADEMRTLMKRKLGIDSNKDINQLSIADMRGVGSEKKSGSQIAVYYAEGEIVDSPMEDLPFMSGTTIVGDDMANDITRLRDDDDVKAVVLRVNSPGGAAYAAEQIWHSVATLQEKKPVVVSMGDYAASGGYYISCNAAWIVAQPTTLTGSIGIFGIIPEASELLKEKLSLHFDGVQTNRHSDLGASVFSLAQRPLDSDEAALFQAYIERGYVLFRQRVADGRQLPTDSVEAIAQGHVWLGQDALRLHLVDQLGGIDDAIAKAAELAELDDYYTAPYPTEANWLDVLLKEKDSNNHLDALLRSTLGDWYEPFLFMKSAAQQNPIQARIPFFLTIK